MEVRMKIIDINGKVLLNKMIAGEQEVTIQLDSICKPGTYVLLINDEGKKTKEKFVVIWYIYYINRINSKIMKRAIPSTRNTRVDDCNGEFSR